MQWRLELCLPRAEHMLGECPWCCLGCSAELLLGGLALNLVCSSCHVQKGLSIAIPWNSLPEKERSFTCWVQVIWVCKSSVVISSLRQLPEDAGLVGLGMLGNIFVGCAVPPELSFRSWIQYWEELLINQVVVPPFRGIFRGWINGLTRNEAQQRALQSPALGKEQPQAPGQTRDWQSKASSKKGTGHKVDHKPAMCHYGQSGHQPPGLP